MKKLKNLITSTDTFRRVPVLVLLFIAMACEKIIEPGELPQQDSRLVLNCILNNDSLNTADISLSKSILNNKPYQAVENAICMLYENDVFKEHLVHIGKGRYKGQTSPVTGRKYSIKVNSAGYDEVNATTLMPANVSIADVKRYDTINYSLSMQEYETGSGPVKTLNGSLRFRFNIVDTDEKPNFYAVEAFVRLYDSSGTEMLPPVEYPGLYENSSGGLFGGGGYYGGSTIEKDDLGKVGTNIGVDVTLSVFDQVYRFGKVDHVKIFLKLYSQSEEYFRYKQTINQQATSGISFFAEPVLIYSNVSNGMGILGAANTNTVYFYRVTPFNN